MNKVDLICLFLLLLIPINYLCIFLYIKYGFLKNFYHDFLGWCEPEDKQYFAGINIASTCKYCKKRILQDSQGGWFPVPNNKECENE